MSHLAGRQGLKKDVPEAVTIRTGVGWEASDTSFSFAQRVCLHVLAVLTLVDLDLGVLGGLLSLVAELLK